MSQILHIFRKDTRRFWIEIFASLVALSIFACFYPSRWNFSPEAMHWQIMNSLLMLLVPATWWLLIARVIHAESLVGENHFWLTRPYEWKRLLAAKVLFVLAWIYMPFVIAQAAILKEGGFSPLTHAAGWSYSLIKWSGYVILPLLAMAVITPNFARMTLTLFGSIVAMIAAVYLVSVPHAGYESMVPYDHSIWIILVLVMGVLLAIPLQYALRRVWLARAVMFGAVALAIALGMTLTALRDSQIASQYLTSIASPVQLAFAPTSEPLQTTPSERLDKVYISVPLAFSGVAEGSAVQVDDVKFSIDAPDGSHWEAPWWTSQPLRFLPGMHQARVQIMMSREQYERFKSVPITLHLALAVTELHAGSDTTATMSTDDFPVSSFGVCSTRWLYRFPSQLICRSALGEPPLTRVSATWSKAPCSGPQPDKSAAPTAASWNGVTSSKPFGFGFFPVVPVLVNLDPRGNGGGMLASRRGLELCPGTPVHFMQYLITRRTQVYLTVPNFHLPEEPR